MTRMMTTDAKEAQGAEVVLSYPDNQLKAPVRDYEETLSAFQVIKEAFFTEK